MDVRRTTGTALAALTALAVLVPASPAPFAAAPAWAAELPGTSTEDRPAAVPGLVQPVPQQGAVDDPEPGVLRARTVEVDAEVLPDTAAEAAKGVELPLFADTRVVADLEPPTLTQAGHQVWHGTLAGAQDSSVVMVERQGVLTGFVADEDGGTYRLRPTDDGATVVEQLDPSSFPEAHQHPAPPGGAVTAAVGAEHDHSTHDHSAPDAAATTTGDASSATDGSTGPVVDVLVAYTTAAKTRMGGLAAMEADVALAVEQANQAFATSGVHASLRLVHTVEVSGNGNADPTSLNRLTDPDDGYYDQVHALRDQYGADLVSLIVDDTAHQYCGIAWQMMRDSVGFASLGMSVTDARCSTGNMTFAHELGHNFGAAHDRGSWSGTPAYPYGYDWVNSAAKWRTVMSYANACSGCTRLLRFSNPDQTVGGAPVGAPIGAPNQADNRALLNVTASTVAAFRGQPVAPTLTVGPVAGTGVTATGRSTVRWTTTGNVGPTVKVELLRGSTPVSVLAAAAPAGTGAFHWTAAGTLPRSDDYRLRVTSVALPSLTASTDPFPVVDPTIALTSHGSAGTWPAATPQTVRWSYTGAPTGGVRLELLREGHVVQVLSPAAPVGTAGSGAFTFTPAALGSYPDHRLRATLVAFPASTDTSDADQAFTGPGAVRLTSDGTDSTWTAGAARTITWTATGAVGTTVRAQLFKGRSTTALLTATAPVGAGTLTWTPPARLASGDDYRLVLSASSSPKVLDTADGRITVDGTSVSVEEPDAEWVTGTPRTIRWTRVGAPGTALLLELVPPTGPVTVISAAAPIAAGSFSWTPSLVLPADVPYRLRATVVGNVGVTDTTDEALRLRTPTLALTPAPPTWVLGVPVDLSWSFSDGVPAPVRLQLVRGTSATSIASSVASPSGSGTYRWTPPPTLLVADDYRLRVTATTAAAVAATSGTLSVQRPTVALTAPAITSGAPAPLSWRFSDPVTTPVRVDLFRGTALVATPVANGATANGSGSSTWAVPATLPGGSYTLRVRPVATAASAAVEHTVTVTVTGPGVTVPTPSSWRRGAAVTATWSYDRWSGGTARVELLRGTGVAAVLASAAPQSAGAGTVSWRVPATLALGATYAVRVTLPGSASATSGTFSVTA